MEARTIRTAFTAADLQAGRVSPPTLPHPLPQLELKVILSASIHPLSTIALPKIERSIFATPLEDAGATMKTEMQSGRGEGSLFRISLERGVTIVSSLGEMIEY
ncbi:unnamed protein product, partial [Nezara viridula]